MQRLEARVEALEQQLRLHGIPLPAEADVDTSWLPDLSFPQLDFSEGRSQAPRPIRAEAALEIYPHIIATLTSLWGKDGFEEYLGRLIVDDRGNRKGFSMDVMEELLVLGRIYRQRKIYFAQDRARPGDIWIDIREVTRRSAAS